jgi:transcriptional regulator with XRE-family HTH domain
LRTSRRGHTSSHTSLACYDRAQAEEGLVAEQPITFAELLREHRLARGLTQAELAQHAGLSERAISDLERGLKRPKRGTVRLLATALELAGQDASTFEAARGTGSQNGQPRAGQVHGGDRTLPRPLTSFVGRERELGQLEVLLAGSRLLTLTGPGGSGKTRLALRLATAVAERFEDGVVFVPLASVFEPSLVLATLAQTLGLPEIGRRAPLAVLRQYLQRRHLLLVLDNFEHLLAAGSLASKSTKSRHWRCPTTAGDVQPSLTRLPCCSAPRRCGSL